MEGCSTLSHFGCKMINVESLQVLRQFFVCLFVLDFVFCFLNKRTWGWRDSSAALSLHGFNFYTHNTIPTISNSSSKGFYALFWLPQVPSTHCLDMVHRQTCNENTYMYKKQLRNEIPLGMQEATVYSKGMGKFNEYQKYTLLQAPLGTSS